MAVPFVTVPYFPSSSTESSDALVSRFPSTPFLDRLSLRSQAWHSHVGHENRKIVQIDRAVVIRIAVHRPAGALALCASRSAPALSSKAYRLRISASPPSAKSGSVVGSGTTVRATASSGVSTGFVEPLAAREQR